MLTVRKLGNILAYSFIFIFAGIALIRLYPFDLSLTEILSGAYDDWCMYINTALDIKRNGLLISSAKGDYDYPNGFFYNYFVAFCFLIFGENPVPVYILQSCLLGITIAIVFWTYRDKMNPKTSILFIVMLFIFALLDVNKYYTFRFLSENLVLFTLAMFFYCFIKGIENKKYGLLISSALFLGLSVLTRPNLFPIAILILLAICFWSIKGKIKFTSALFFLLILFSSISLLAFRNKLVSGNWTFFPVNSFTFFKEFFFHPDNMLVHMFKKFLFCVGYLPAIVATFHWRVHWTIMWILYFTYLFLRFKEKRKFEIWESVSHLFIFAYLGSLVFVIDINLLTVYGFRYVLPLNFMVLVFAFLELERILARRRLGET